MKVSSIKSSEQQNQKPFKVKVRDFFKDILAFVGLWIVLCYNPKMTLREASICSSMVVGAVFSGTARQ